MKQWFRKYWPELLTIAVVFGVLLWCAAPNYTWMNTDSDGIHYVYSAKYLLPAHNTSAPLFLLLGHMFLKLPFGTEAWRIALLSVIASTISAVFVYLIVREKVEKRSRTLGIISALVFGGSALVISQSTIVESYALVTMFALGAYYFAIREKWVMCAVMLGAGGAVHHIIGLTGIVLFVGYRVLRKPKYIGITSAFLAFYLFIPITMMLRNAPDMWGNATLSSFMNDNASTALMLIGGLSIWDFPKRVLDTLGIVGVSLGIALVPIVYFIAKSKFREPLVWLFLLPIAYYATNLAPQTYVYMTLAIGFGAIAAGIGLSQMGEKWRYAVLTCAVGLLAFNSYFMAIGRTLDANLSASKYYYSELDKVPDGQILMPKYDWEWAAIIPYNTEFNREIVGVCVGTLPSPYYQAQLKERGIGLRSYPDEPIGKQSGLIATSIVELNENVWTTQIIDPRTYGTSVVHTNGDSELFNVEFPDIKPSVRWKPSNPYGIITGAIEIEEWVFILQSNYSMLTFAMLGVIGFVPVWVGWQVVVKKKKWSIRMLKGG